MVHFPAPFLFPLISYFYSHLPNHEKPPRQNLDITESGPIHHRGTARMEETYQANLSPIFASWGSHRADLEYIEKSIIYGLFLSDLSVLDSKESQMVSLVAILCGGYRGPSVWHLRGLRRVGCSAEEVDGVADVARKVARWAGKTKEEVEAWPACKDIPAGDV